MKPPSLLAGIRIGLLFTAITTNLFLMFFIGVVGLPLFISWIILTAAMVLLIKELMALFLIKK